MPALPFSEEVLNDYGLLDGMLLHVSGVWTFFPKTPQDVATILQWAQKTTTPLSLDLETARRLPVPLWLNVERLNQIRDHLEADFIVTVETGMTVGDLQAYLAPFNQCFPLTYNAKTRLIDVLAEDRPALETGIREFPRDRVLGLEMVTPDGDITHCGGQVVKNVSGYDLNKLYVGSQHLLGALTAVTLKLSPLPVQERSWVLGCSDLSQAVAMAEKMLKANMSTLTGLEIFNTDRFTVPGLETPWMMWVRLSGLAALVQQDGQWVEKFIEAHPHPTMTPLMEDGGNRWVNDWVEALGNLCYEDNGEGLPEIQDSNPPPQSVCLLLELALPMGSWKKIFSRLSSDWLLDIPQPSQSAQPKPIVKPIVQYRPAAGLLWLGWSFYAVAELLDKEDWMVRVAALQREVQGVGGLLQGVQIPLHWQQLVTVLHGSEPSLVQVLMDRIKSTYDPLGILRNHRISFGEDMGGDPDRPGTDDSSVVSGQGEPSP